MSMGTTPDTSAEILRFAWPLVLSLVAMLLAINGWFIAGLARKVDSLVGLGPKVEAMGGELARLARGQEDISALRERIAVLESQMKQGKDHGRGTH